MSPQRLRNRRSRSNGRSSLFMMVRKGDADFTRIHRLARKCHSITWASFYDSTDIRAKLPEPVEIERYRGVLTWFVGSVSDSNVYLAWANQVSANERALRHPGRCWDRDPIPRTSWPRPTNCWLWPESNIPANMSHRRSGPAWCRRTRVSSRFECRLDPVLPDYPVIGNAKWGRHADRSDARNATP